jgi:dienelactone hydrolase
MNDIINQWKAKRVRIRVLRVLTATVFLLLFTALTGCALHYQADRSLRAARPLPEAVAAEFFYPRADVAYSEILLEDKDDYTVRRIEFESTHNVIPVPHTIRMDYYALKNVENAPVILVLPILGGKNVIAKIFARYFVENGYAAVIVHRQREYKDIAELDRINPTLKQMVIDHMQAVDWIETRKELDASRIGVFGVSMGAIKAAMLAPLDPRIKAAVLGMPGGDIAYLLAYSAERRIGRNRSKYMEQTGFTPDRLYDHLRSAITCDPMRFAPWLDPADVLMFLAWFDASIPYSRGKALWRAAGKPEVVYLVSGHLSAYVYLPYVKAKTLSFFNRRLGKAAALP